MESKYFILEIKGMIDNMYGDCAVVYANPIHEIDMGFHKSQSYTPYKNSETQLFFFPSDDSIIQPLIRLARSQKAWEPYFGDFKEARIYDETEGEHKQIYRHRSFFDNEYKSFLDDQQRVVWYDF